MGQHTGLLVLTVTNILCPKLTRMQKNERVKTNPSRLQRRRKKEVVVTESQDVSK